MTLAVADRTCSPAQSAAPTPAAAPAAGKADDLYQMAIQYKKEEDFSGWYTDVSQLYSAQAISRS